MLQQNEQRIAANQAALNQVGGLQHMPGIATPTPGPRGLGSMSPAPQNISRPRKTLFSLLHLFCLFEFMNASKAKLMQLKSKKPSPLLLYQL